MGGFCLEKDKFIEKLLLWWQKNKRSFPWRRTKDPFKVLCAEILLQQTNAEKVVPAYKKLTCKFPKVQDLAEADISEIEKIIKPLGLIKRAERLKNLSAVIVSEYNGRVIPEKEELMKLPGVGNYASNAVLSFAYKKQVGVLDTNTIRILKRVFGIETDKARARTDNKIQESLNNLVEGRNSRNINYALLDFAAEICRKRNPKCCNCPVNDMCLEYLGG